MTRASGKSERVPIMMSKEEVEALDDWRFANRVNGRAEAIRRLVQIGMSADSKAPADAGP